MWEGPARPSLPRLALALHWAGPRLTSGVAHNHRMSNHERDLRPGIDWRELIASLLVAAAIGMFTVYGLVYFMRAMM